MKLPVAQRVIGMLVMAFSTVMIVPAGVALYFDDGMTEVFLRTFALILGAGALLWIPARSVRNELRRRDSVIVVASLWAILGVAGSIPFLLTGALHLGVTDAVFESMSGLTTTGATVIVGLDALPRSLLFYRQFLQWAGGIGIVVLGVAILPFLGVGGMQLLSTESPSPARDRKLTPRISETAKALWGIYCALTVLCALAYGMSGMTWFDAICHSFSTVSLGAFSTHDASFAYFQSPLLEFVAIVFMFISGASFVVHFQAMRQLSLGVYWRDPEFRTYTMVLFSLAVVVIAYLVHVDFYPVFGTDVINGLFHVVSIMTTTGYTATDLTQWPAVLPVLLILSSFIGACTKSTGGGMKVIRWLLLVKQGWREVRRLIHPRAEIVTKIGKHRIPDRVVGAVWGFFSVYVVVFAALMLLTMLTGLDHVEAFSAVAATLNNLGPGLGAVSESYALIPETTKWLLMLAMLLGRLEIFALLLLLTPTFWRN